MAFDVLMVCRANVCRSPLAATRLAEKLAAAGNFDVAIASRGIDARPGTPWCKKVRSPGASTELVEEDLDADMLIAADRQVTGTLLRRRTSLRARTFTMLEVGLLGPHVVQTPSGGGAPSGEEDKHVALRWLVEEMDQRRGETALAGARNRGPQRPRPADEAGLDIRDGHNLGWRAHRRTVAQVEWSMSRLARAMSTLSG